MKSRSRAAIVLRIATSPISGRGVFAVTPIKRGRKILAISGTVVRADRIPPWGMGIQIDEALWLWSDGRGLDDFTNHSCAPNAGFVRGTTTLFALRNMAPGEEICWDYSTSIDEAGWSMTCRCGAANCRHVVQPFHALGPAGQERLLGISLRYLRQKLPTEIGLV